jgi:hypothetical protein
MHLTPTLSFPRKRESRDACKYWNTRILTEFNDTNPIFGIGFMTIMSLRARAFSRERSMAGGNLEINQ